MSISPGGDGQPSVDYLDFYEFRGFNDTEMYPDINQDIHVEGGFKNNRRILHSNGNINRVPKSRYFNRLQ